MGAIESFDFKWLGGFASICVSDKSTEGTTETEVFKQVFSDFDLGVIARKLNSD